VGRERPLSDGGGRIVGLIVGMTDCAEVVVPEVFERLPVVPVFCVVVVPPVVPLLKVVVVPGVVPVVVTVVVVVLVPVF
jgi:hypothetical protein